MFNFNHKEMKRIIYLMFFAFALSTNVVLAENENDVVSQSEVLPIPIEILTQEDEKAKELAITQWLLANSKYFKDCDLMTIKKELQCLSIEQIQLMGTCEFLHPTANVVVSVLVGSWGVDRFLIGQTGWGILKLLTGGGLGVWTIVDWFQINGLTKKANMAKFLEYKMLIKEGVKVTITI